MEILDLTAASAPPDQSRESGDPLLQRSTTRARGIASERRERVEDRSGALQEAATPVIVQMSPDGERLTTEKIDNDTRSLAAAI